HRNRLQRLTGIAAGVSNRGLREGNSPDWARMVHSFERSRTARKSVAPGRPCRLFRRTSETRVLTGRDRLDVQDESGSRIGPAVELPRHFKQFHDLTCRRHDWIIWEAAGFLYISHYLRHSHPTLF